MRIYIIIYILLGLSCCAYSQNLNVCFYNVENLFDTKDDPSKEDNNFTPDGEKRWNESKYNDKLQKIGKAIIASCQYKAPHIIGLAESENKKVLNDLIKKTPLKYYPYKIIHYPSNDPRGIECALLYLSNDIEIIRDTFLRPMSPLKQTRDIIYTQLSFHKDTFNVYVNHWPSRYNGKKKTAHKRMEISNFLASKIKTNENNILMGDFNDNPTDYSIQNLLSKGKLQACKGDNSAHGTIKYKGDWYYFDYFYLSKNLVNRSIYYSASEIDWLFTKDEQHTGYKPFRSWQGPKYLGGFSDHLPIFMEISVSN